MKKKAILLIGAVYQLIVRRSCPYLVLRYDSYSGTINFIMNFFASLLNVLGQYDSYMVLYGIFCYYNTNGDEHLAHKALEVIHGVILTIE